MAIAVFAVDTSWVTALRRSFPAEGYFAGSAVFHYLGPAFAVLLFAHVGVLGVAWLRIASAAVVFAAWRRPWRWYARLGRPERYTVVALGVTLAVMNACFYLAIDRLPLGTVAAIEFLGPTIVAAAGMRTRRNQLALALVVCGVYLVTGVRLHGQAAGFAFAFANAALFALYVVLGHRVARAGANIDALAAAMLVAALVITPIGLLAAAPALTVPASIAAGIGVGVTSSVIPYVCDQLAMARLGRSAYALMVSLLPATAVVVGIVVLGQVPTLAAIAGVALVMAGVAGHRDRDQIA
jgi:inner membrane transporter RhtA